MTRLAELYNLCCVSIHGPKKLAFLFDRKGKRAMSSSSVSFCQTELRRALKEQAFGIKSFAMVSFSHDQASASVVLLEGTEVVIQLTTQRYCVVTPESAGTPYETIEDLLQAISTLYANKRQELLFAKLAKLS